MLECTKCQGVPNVCGLIVWVPNVRVYQMSGCTKCHWCTKCHVILETNALSSKAYLEIGARKKAIFSHIEEF